MSSGQAAETEYGGRLDWDEFLADLAGCREDTGAIGRWFRWRGRARRHMDD